MKYCVRKIFFTISLAMSFSGNVFANQCESYLNFKENMVSKTFQINLDGQTLILQGENVQLYEIWDSTSSVFEDSHYFVISNLKAHIPGDVNFLGRLKTYSVAGDLDEVCRQVTQGQYPYRQNLYKHRHFSSLFSEKVVFIERDLKDQFILKTVNGADVDHYATHLVCGSHPDKN